jgi:alcohol dehydrogenase
MNITAGKGVDVAIEAVGVRGSFDVCQSILAPGGRLANIGVYGTSVELHMERLWSHNITLTTRLVDTAATAMLLKVVQSGRLQPRKLVTHRFRLADTMAAYDTFGNAAKERALKVVLQNS